jgi:hypothetical protein
MQRMLWSGYDRILSKSSEPKSKIIAVVAEDSTSLGSCPWGSSMKRQAPG